VKSAIGGFSATDILTRRGEVALAVETEVRRAMERFPIVVASLQIDDVSLPESYMEAVRRREEARQETEAAEQRLMLQRVEAQRQVQEAEAAAQATTASAKAALERTRAEAQGKLALAQAEAEGIRAIGEAKADALRAEADALTANPTLVELERARRWSGAVPNIVIGENSGALPFLDIARMGEKP
jgi:regulator of protease activity HflC (stomatin/prohibitin superfamily)